MEPPVNERERREKRERDPRAGSCSFCANYVYDEEGGYYACMVQLDEDEMEKFLTDSFQGGCPDYRLEDEYRTVRKQM